nr:EOG090X04WQ [Eulimnadia texana]
MKKSVLGTVLLAFVATVAGISSYLSPADLNRMRQVLESGLSSDDLSTLDHSVRGLAALGVEIPQKSSICQKVGQLVTEKASSDVFFHIFYLSNLLKTFKNAFRYQETLNNAISSASSVSEVFFATGALSSFGLNLDASKILKSLNTILKKDDSLASLGQAFHVASLLEGDVSSIFSRVEDAIVQADLVDNRMLQFEGGLSVTALVISGAYQLAKTVGKAPPVTKDQANKFGEYFVSRRSVQTVKGIHSLLEVANIFADNPYHVPVAVTLSSKSSVSKGEPSLKVKVSNILGKPLGSLNVVADSATRVQDDAVVLSQKQLSPIDEATYDLDLMSVNPGKGVYRVSISASSSDARLVGNSGAIVEVKVLTRIAVEDAEIGTADADQSTAAKLRKVAFPNAFDEVLEADSHQKLLLKFALRDVNSKELATVHQAFVRLTHIESQQEIFFVAEPDLNDLYKFDLDLSAKAKEFQFLSGAYQMDLIVGDAVIENPFVWNVAKIQLTFSQVATKTQEKKAAEMYKPKPEIKHMFREPEKRPPTIVSNAFTLLVILPFVLFLALLVKLGANISNFPFSLSAVGFHGTLGAILLLYLCFWVKLNMFQTLNYLVVLSVILFLTGNRLLTHLAEKSSRS